MTYCESIDLINKCRKMLERDSSNAIARKYTTLALKKMFNSNSGILICRENIEEYFGVNFDFCFDPIIIKPIGDMIGDAIHQKQTCAQ